MSVQVVQEQALTTLLAVRWDQASQKIAALAAEIPAEEFEKAPAPDIRTCGAVLRHVAFWNQYVADSLGGKEVNESANELPSSEYPDKESILRELIRSSQQAESALRSHSTSLTPKMAELMMTFIEHTSEHYGQLVVYGRMLGIVPPASRA